MQPFIVNVRTILGEVGASLDVSKHYDIERLEVGSEVFDIGQPVAVEVIITNAGEGIVASGHVVAHATTACVRCLCDFEITLTGEIGTLFLRSSEPVFEGEDAEVVDPEGNLDLAPAIHAALVLEAPFAPLHDDACLGLCSGCGTDLNEAECGCSSDIDPMHPFAAVRSLIEPHDPEAPA